MCRRFPSPEHAASTCIDDEQCLAVTCTPSIDQPPPATGGGIGGGHCRMVTRKSEAVRLLC